MPNLNFKQGIKTDLPSSKTEGTIYYTNDENLLYIDKKEGSTGDLERAQITPIIYTADECTTFTNDISTGVIGAGTCTPAAVQKAAKQFAITRPQEKNVAQTTTDKAIARWENINGDLQNSKIIIEDVTNTKDTSLTAQVIAIPTEGNKKMVYGYCTNQTDGTSFIGGLFDKTATEYPYNEGLAIEGSSGDLLWKSKKVATSDELPTGFTIAPTLTDDDIINLTGSAGTNSFNLDAKHANKGPDNGFAHENTTTNFTIPNLTIDDYGHTTAATKGQQFIIADTLPTEVTNGAICIVY